MNNSLAHLLMDLSVAGVELAADPRDAERILHRPAVLQPDLAARLKVHKMAILAMLGSEQKVRGRYRPGSPAWCGAMARPDGHAPQRLAECLSSILGVPMYAEVIPAGERFEGEPDWGNNPLYLNGRRGPGEITQDDRASGQCRVCRRKRWWKLPGQRIPTCGGCHPPAPGLRVEWLDTEVQP